MSPAVALVRNAVDSFVERQHITEGSLILVAVSGGADSMALASAALFVADKRAIRVAAAVIDHGLQSGSADVAERTAAILRDRGCDTVVVRRVAVGTEGGESPLLWVEAGRVAAAVGEAGRVAAVG